MTDNPDNHGLGALVGLTLSPSGSDLWRRFVARHLPSFSFPFSLLLPPNTPREWAASGSPLLPGPAPCPHPVLGAAISPPHQQVTLSRLLSASLPACLSAAAAAVVAASGSAIILTRRRSPARGAEEPREGARRGGPIGAPGQVTSPRSARGFPKAGARACWALQGRRRYLGPEGRDGGRIPRLGTSCCAPSRRRKPL